MASGNQQGAILSNNSANEKATDASTDKEVVLYEVDRGRARITLNRPEKRNALSVDLLRRLDQLLWEADNDTRVRAVILRANGRDFCAGYDLTHYERIGESSAHRRGSTSVADDSWRLEQSQRLRMTIFDMHKPVIAQVHGHCLAGGSDLALLCDLVICADDSRIGFPATRAQGSPPNHMWLYLMGPQWAKRLLFTGDMLLGKDAARLGLALASYPAEKLENAVESLMDRLTLVDAELLAAQKRIVNLGMELMGARTLQRMAAEMDAKAHTTLSREQFRQSVKAHGVRDAVRIRDEPFGSGIVEF